MQQLLHKSVLSAIFKLLTTGDKILLIVILFLSIFSIVLLQNYRQPGEIVVIKTANQIQHQLNLSENKELTVIGPVGKTCIQIKDKKVRVTHSDCPQKICEKTGWINKTDEFIVCVPNKVVISINGKGSKFFDVITQ